MLTLAPLYHLLARKKIRRCVLHRLLNSLLLPPSAAGERDFGDYLSPGQGSPDPQQRAAALCTPALDGC